MNIRDNIWEQIDRLQLGLNTGIKRQSDTQTVMTGEYKQTKRKREKIDSLAKTKLTISIMFERNSFRSHLTSAWDADFCINSENQKLSKVLNWFELNFRRLQTLPVSLSLTHTHTLSLSLSLTFAHTLSFTLTKSPRNVLSKKFFYSFWFRDFFSSLWLQESLSSPTIYFQNLFFALPGDQFSSGNVFLKSCIALHRSCN